MKSRSDQVRTQYAFMSGYSLSFVEREPTRAYKEACPVLRESKSELMDSSCKGVSNSTSIDENASSGDASRTNTYTVSANIRY